MNEERRGFWGWAFLLLGWALLLGTLAVYTLGLVVALKALWRALT